MTNNWLHLSTVICFGAFLAGIPAAAQNQAHYTRSELKRLEREARTADQVRELARWYRGEEQVFRQKAKDENQELLRRQKMVLPGKFPNPVDSARSLRDYHNYKADQMAKRAARYETELQRLDPMYRIVPAEPVVSFSPSEKVLLDRIQRLERQVQQLQEQ
jgi:hypothetical protein